MSPSRQLPPAPVEPGMARVAVVLFQGNFWPGIGEVRILITLVGHFRVVHLGGAETEQHRLASSAFALRVMSQERSETTAFCSLSGSNRATETPWSSVLTISNCPGSSVRIWSSSGTRPRAGRLDFQDQLALVGLALVERLA